MPDTPAALADAIQPNRAEFERWATRMGYNMRKHKRDVGPYKAGDYVGGSTIEAWIVWQGATTAAASDALRAMAWRPITEAPRDGTHVLIRYRWAYREVYTAEGWWHINGWRCHGFPDVRAFEFMPLPPAPGETK